MLDLQRNCTLTCPTAVLCKIELRTRRHHFPPSLSHSTHCQKKTPSITSTVLLYLDRFLCIYSCSFTVRTLILRTLPCANLPFTPSRLCRDCTVSERSTSSYLITHSRGFSFGRRGFNEAWCRDRAVYHAERQSSVECLRLSFSSAAPCESRVGRRKVVAEGKPVQRGHRPHCLRLCDVHFSPAASLAVHASREEASQEKQ